MNDLKKNATRAVVWQVLLSFLLYFISIFNNMFVTRLLSPEIFGTFALGVFLFDLIQRPRLLGLNYSLIAKHKWDDLDLQTHFQLKTVLSIGIILLTFIVLPFLHKKYSTPVLLVALACSFASILDTEGVAGTPVAILEKSLMYGKLSRFELIANIGNVLTALLLAWIGWGVWSLVLSQKFVMPLILLFGYWSLSSWKPSMKWVWDKQRVKWFLFHQGSFLWVAGILNFIVISVDVAVVGTFLGVTELGYYSRGLALARMSLMVLGAFSRVAFPVYSSIQNDDQRQARAFTDIAGITVRLGFAAALVFIFAPYETISVLYGPKWMALAPILAWFSISTFARPLFDSIGGFYIATHQTKSYMHYSLFYSALTLGAVAFGAWKWGLVGAAAGSGLSLLIAVLVMQVGLLKRFPISLKKIYINPLLATIPVLIVFLFFIHAKPISFDNSTRVQRVLALVSRGALIGILYLVGQWIFDREYLKMFFSRFKELLLKRGQTI